MKPVNDPLAALIDGFFAVGQHTLTEALRGEPELRFEPRLEAFEDGQLVELRPMDSVRVHGLFAAVVRFAGAALEGELTYGDREMFLNLVVSARPRPAGASASYGLWEWAAVFGERAGLQPGQADGATWVTRVDAIQREVTVLASALGALAPYIESAGADDIARLEAARQRQREQWRAERRRDEMRGDSDRARVAFDSGSYDEVVRLLEPYGDSLGPAARKRLEMARSARTR